MPILCCKLCRRRRGPMDQARLAFLFRMFCRVPFRFAGSGAPSAGCPGRGPGSANSHGTSRPLRSAPDEIERAKPLPPGRRRRRRSRSRDRLDRPLVRPGLAPCPRRRRRPGRGQGLWRASGRYQRSPTKPPGRSIPTAGARRNLACASCHSRMRAVRAEVNLRKKVRGARRICRIIKTSTQIETDRAEVVMDFSIANDPIFSAAQQT